MSTSAKPPIDAATASPDQLCQQMRAIRRDLGQNVQEIVGQAERLMDWRYYVQRYPWASVGAAVVLGYFIVPRRTSLLPTDATTLTRLAQHIPVTVQVPIERKRPTLFKSLITMGTTLATRAALSYISHKLASFGTPPATKSRPAQTTHYV